MKPLKYKFYRVSNTLIVMYVVLQGLVRDCMAKGDYRLSYRVRLQKTGLAKKLGYN